MALLTSFGCPTIWFEVDECWSLRELAYGWDVPDLPTEVVPAWVDANKRMDCLSRTRARARSWVSSVSSEKMADTEQRPLVDFLSRAPDLIPRRLAPEFTVPRITGIAEAAAALESSVGDRASAIKKGVR